VERIMLYSILKDDKPSNTVNRIKNILNGLNIKLEENFYYDKDKYAPVSLRLFFKGNLNVGTNGKGTCIENATASAYAEFIERLQNLFLFNDYNDNIFVIPDKVKADKNVEFCDDKLKQYFKNKLLNFEKMKKNSLLADELFLYPFYSVKKQDVYNLPYTVIYKTKGSNGMAAGNTLEEAIVQGLSEVCERYVLKKVFQNKLKLPDIPEEEYLKYENIKNIINYFENNGYKIHIKDASLNGQVPVVCTIIEDLKNNLFCPSFGAHPSLPIAIERTLTEFTQGLMLSTFREHNFVGYQCYSEEKLKYTTIESMYKALFLYKVAFARIKKLEDIFFADKKSYEYYKENWIDENKVYTNKELLDFIVNKILVFSDDIYIRNVSFLGFPTVDIFIPDVTDIAEYDEKTIKVRQLDLFWESYYKNSNKKEYTLESLLQLSELFSFNETLTSRKIFQAPFEYISLLCSIVLKDTNRILKYTDVVVSQNKVKRNYDKGQILAFEIIKQYYTYKKTNTKDKDIIEKLNREYKKADVKYVLDIINDLAFEDILDIVLNNEKVKKFRCKTLLKKLAVKYKKNLPDQMVFKSILTP